MSKPKVERVVQEKLNYNDLINWLEKKYNFKSRGFTGIPSMLNYENHFNDWCNKHGLPQKDSEGKHRGSSQIFWKQYNEAEDGERTRPPYLDYWHYLVDINEILSNGSFIYIPRKVGKNKEENLKENIEFFREKLKKEKSHIIKTGLKKLIESLEEDLSGLNMNPCANWEQDITDLIFKEFGEFAEDDCLKVWVEW
jgi:hypothetical protein